VAAAFSKRRKTLHNALKGFADDDQMRSAGIDPAQRPEQIPVARWIELAKLLCG
jgi:16S rRNA (adenine1518-N6/adenine1519-N6)-dimethyltransferase